MTDSIRLTIPHTKPYYGVARLVVGGLAARLNLSFEHLEDLQLALESLLGNEAYAAASDVSVELIVDGGAVEMLVGPLDGSRIRSDLEREPDEAEGVGLQRVLATVVEGVEVERRDGHEWLRLHKRIEPGEV